MVDFGRHTIIVIPTFNNAGTIADVVQRSLSLGLPLIVVNDGSTDGTDMILRRIRQLNPEHVHVITLPSNQGKGAALKAAFKYALREGYSYAVTLDADGQHSPEEIPVLLEKARDMTLVIGSRNISAEGMPSGNTFANKFSNFWFFVQTLRHLPDTQSGFRVYPLKGISFMRLMTNRYEAELFLLVFSAWKGISLVPVPIHVSYPVDRVSHFRPILDFLRITLLNISLCVTAILYGYPRMFIRWLIGLRTG